MMLGECGKGRIAVPLAFPLGGARVCLLHQQAETAYKNMLKVTVVSTAENPVIVCYFCTRHSSHSCVHGQCTAFGNQG
jgi:hypothetical protein